MGILLGIDIGTTKLCALALDASTGALIAAEDVLNDSQIISEPDAVEQDATAIVSKCLDLLKRLVTRPELKGQGTAAIGVTGQMHGVVIVDKSFRPLTPLVTWQDKRGNQLLPGSDHSYVEELARLLGDDGLQASGCAPATGYGAVTLLRMREEGSLPKSGTALTIHDLVVATLCGVAATDPTDAASWGIFDVRNGSGWLPQALDALEVPEGMLPPVVSTGSVAGGLLLDIAAQTGLPSGLPVAAALGDNQASFIGSVPSMSDSVLFNLGTGGQMSVPIDHFASAQDEGLDTRPLIAGKWLLVGASLCGGRAYEILERFFAGVGRDLFGIEPTEKLYERMNHLASQASEERGGLGAVTAFEGTRVDPTAGGIIDGITANNFAAGNLTRAIIGGMVEELTLFLETAMRLGSNPRVLAGSGNAVRRNPVVRTEIERLVEMCLRMPPHPEEAAVGAALTAGVAAGVYDDWDTAGNILFGNRNVPEPS